MLFVPAAAWSRRRFALVNSGIGTSSTITIPSGLRAGDLCLIFNRARGSPTDVVPSGFTELQTILASSSTRGSMHAKKLTGTETTVTGMVGATDQSWIALVLRPGNAFSSFSFTSSGNQGTTSNPTAQTIAISEIAPPVLPCGQMIAAASAVPSRVFTPMSELDAGTTFHYAHYKIYDQNDAPADISYDMGDGDTNVLQSGYLTFS